MRFLSFLLILTFAAPALAEERTASYGNKKPRAEKPITVKKEDKAPIGTQQIFGRRSGFESSPEIDQASEASILRGKRLDAPVRDDHREDVPRIQELGF